MYRLIAALHLYMQCICMHRAKVLPQAQQSGLASIRESKQLPQKHRRNFIFCYTGF